MIADYESMIDSFGKDVTRKRRAAGTDSYGIYTPGSTTSTTIRAVVVRGLQSEDLLPQGQSTGEVLTIYTSADLQPVQAPGGALGDLVVEAGEDFEVRAVRAWTDHGNFIEAVAVKVAQ